MTLLEEWAQDGREVAVAGLGRSGVAATRLLFSRGIAVYASDSARDRIDQAVSLERMGEGRISATAGGHDLERIARSAALVISPGIPPQSPVIMAAREAGIAVVSETRIGFDAIPQIPWIAVTGTNGKTTTTSLVDHLLRATGRESIAAGNIGTPVSMVATRQNLPEWMAVELSSFQLHDTGQLDPMAGILTNLAPDHLDRYDSIVDYHADKARLFADATPRSIWVSNLDDPASRSLVAGVAGRHLSFSTNVMADAWLDRARGLLMLGSQPLLPRAELGLLGDHNVANALAATLAVHATGGAASRIADGLASFRALPHRMEPVGVVGGVMFINDSKATNIASTRVALAALNRPYVLMMGGRHKGEPYTSLIPQLGERCLAVVAFGEAAALICEDLASTTKVEPAGRMRDAFEIAARLAPAGSAVLLSPACASYDEFENFEQRGHQFSQLVKSL